VGFPAAVDFTQPITMGLQLVRSLSAQLDGTLELDTKSGTLVRLRFPKPPA
jgi:two-component sensor histidine kinase